MLQADQLQHMCKARNLSALPRPAGPTHLPLLALTAAAAFADAPLLPVTMTIVSTSWQSCSRWCGGIWL